MDWEREYGISRDTINTIGEFSILWGYFEQIKFDSDANPTKIKNWTDHVELNRDLKDLCDKIKDKAVIYLKDIDDMTITNRIYSENRSPNDVHRKLISEFLEGNTDNPLPGCSLFILRIRNNMFHGLKKIDTLNEQQEMFSEINQFLHYIIKYSL